MKKLLFTLGLIAVAIGASAGDIYVSAGACAERRHQGGRMEALPLNAVKYGNVQSRNL